MAREPRPARISELPAIASCPSCGRRPSERVALGWRPEYEGPTTMVCGDVVHRYADWGPALEQGLQHLRLMLSKDGRMPQDPVCDEVARLLALAVSPPGEAMATAPGGGR